MTTSHEVPQDAVSQRTFAAMFKNNPAAVVVLKQDELVEAEYIGKTNKAAFFDLGRRGTGIIYGVELINAQDSLKDIAPGNSLLVKVIDPENNEGYVELSLKETHKQKAWDEVKDLKEQGDSFEVTIIGANTGGLLADVKNLKAFLPVSQLSSHHYPQVNDGDKAKILEELQKLVGSSLTVKVIDANVRTNKLILSEKAVMTANVKEQLDKYKVGDIVDGIITGVADFGAFMKFANDTEIEGLIHISELDHRLIDNPKDIIKVDDLVKAKIIDVTEGRVSLSLKALTLNPWEKVEEDFKIGNEVRGIVSRFNPFGAFITLNNDIQGLIHVSEFGGVEEMKKVLVIGESYIFTVELVKPQEKRIVLKLKKEKITKDVDLDK